MTNPFIKQLPSDESYDDFAAPSLPLDDIDDLKDYLLHTFGMTPKEFKTTEIYEEHKDRIHEEYPDLFPEE